MQNFTIQGDVTSIVSFLCIKCILTITLNTNKYGIFFAYLLLLYAGYMHFFRVAISDVDPDPVGSVFIWVQRYMKGKTAFSKQFFRGFFCRKCYFFKSET